MNNYGKPGMGCVSRINHKKNWANKSKKKWETNSDKQKEQKSGYTDGQIRMQVTPIPILYKGEYEIVRVYRHACEGSTMIKKEDIE